MLYYRTIHAKTLELLKEIQNRELFKSLRLVGGSSLALQIGHRVSDDLDLFGLIEADRLSITNELNTIGRVTLLNATENINIFSINDIKVDIVNYPYPWLENEQITDDLRLADIKDIAAMKLAAVTGRGTKKDFIDIFFLLKKFSLEQMLGFYEKKYHDGSIFLVLKSLTYFDDADEDLSPKMLIKISWKEIKQHIAGQINQFSRK